MVFPARPTDVGQIQALLEAEDLDRSAFVLGDFVVAKDAGGRFAGCASRRKSPSFAALALWPFRGKTGRCH
jgi:hypothetical protein